MHGLPHVEAYGCGWLLGLDPKAPDHDGELAVGPFQAPHPGGSSVPCIPGTEPAVHREARLQAGS